MVTTLFVLTKKYLFIHGAKLFVLKLYWTLVYLPPIAEFAEAESQAVNRNKTLIFAPPLREVSFGTNTLITSPETKSTRDADTSAISSANNCCKSINLIN